MNFDIDTLIYESRGSEGGVGFMTPKVKVKKIKLFKSIHWYRLDALAIVDIEDKVHHVGVKNLPEYDHFDLPTQSKHFKICHRIENADSSKKLQNNEPIFAGVYGFTFAMPNNKNEAKGSEYFEVG